MSRVAQRDTEGGNGHFPDGVPADYRNYSDGAGAGANASATDEAEAFRRAVEAMAANWERSPAAASGVVPAAPLPPNEGATRTIVDGSGADNDVEELTVVLFDADGNYLERRHFDAADMTTVEGDLTRRRFTLENLTDGTYKALVLANAEIEITSWINNRSEAQLKAAETIASMRDGIEVAHTLSTSTPWNATPGGALYRRFPMSSRQESFTVPLVRNFETDPVRLLRSLSRVSVTLDQRLAGTGTMRISKVVVRNFNTRGHLIPSEEWGTKVSGSDQTDMLYAPALNHVEGSHTTSGRLVYDYPAGSTPSTGDMFVWEQLADNDSPTWLDWNRDNFCLLVCFDTFAVDGPNGGSASGGQQTWFRIDLLKADGGNNPPRVNIIRNFSYDVTITGISTRGYTTEQEAYENAPAGLTFSIDAQDGEDGDAGLREHTWNGRYQLATDRSVVVIGSEAGATATVMVYTDYENGFTPASASFGPGEVVTATRGTATPNGPRAVPVTLTVGSAYTGSALRKTNFTITAGELFKDMVLIQLPRPEAVVGTSTVLTDYVGAFWRADQRGERLIGLKGGRKWSAFVMDGAQGGQADWVVMDNKLSTDPAVHSNSVTPALGNDAGFESAHPVESTVGWASGEGGEPYLRIGLRSVHAATSGSPARYARVLLVEGSVTGSGGFTNPRVLWLRQGHDADYVFAGRPSSVRFSPYNLTAAGFNGAGVAGGSPTHLALTPREGVFTDYPTQAGAFFKWAHTEGIRAFNPSGGNVAEWNNTNTVTEPWSAVAELYEGCPVGWRRPSDGNTSALNPTVNPAESEMHQSLMQTPPVGLDDSPGNSVWGYYADGFFDRRALGTENAVAATPQSAVSTGRSNVAYTGRLFYNPTTRASLFFPASGAHLAMSGGGLFNTGTLGYYWSASPFDTDKSWNLFIGANDAQRSNNDHNSGFPVRCVKVPQYTPEPGLVEAPPGVIGIRHSDLMDLWAQRKSLGDGTYSLTIRGSSSFSESWVERIARKENLGSLEDEPVYVVYFKWGSTVGVVARTNSTGYTSGDVVWVNNGFNTSLIHSNDWDNASNFAPATPNGSEGYNIPTHNATIGWGDACDFVNGGTAGNVSGWRTPMGGPWTYTDEYGESTPFGTNTSYPAAQITWAEAQSLFGATSRWTSDFGGGAASYDGMLFLPAAGMLDRATGAMHTDNNGAYWTSSASPTANHPYSLLFARNDRLVPSNRAFNHWGSPIRCINCKPVEHIAITGDVDGTPFTSATTPNLTIGNMAETVTLSSSLPTPSDAKEPVNWHWEFAIGNDASWIRIPGSEGKLTLVTSTHEDEADIDFTMVGGTNRFRVVVSNGCSRINSNVLTVSLKLPVLTYAIIGYDIYSWGTNRQLALNAAINNANGVLNANNPNAIIKTAGLRQLWSATTTAAATNLLNNGFTGTVGGTLYQNAQPDILLYFSYPLYPDANLTDALVNYIGAKGTVLYAPACDDPARIHFIGEMLDGIFPGEEITATLKNPNDDDNAYRIWDEINKRDLKDDPIVNGPFGDLSGGECFVGDENLATTCVPKLPAGSVQIAALRNNRTALSAAYPDNYSFVWYNAAKNFFYIGDCTAAINASTDTRAYAAIYNYGSTSSTGMPGSKMYGFYDNNTQSGTRRVYNAVLEMNALAWCMTRAARNGINPH